MLTRKEPFFSVCVFCGSRNGSDPAFMQAASAVGRGLAEGGHRLVYGGGSAGMMGAVGSAARDAGGDVMGVIPEHLLPREGRLAHIENFVITETMHERKKVMFMNSDAFVTLPGGSGSMDEFFEMLTWVQLGLHSKPLYLLNINGYWDKLIGLIEHFVAHGLADPGSLDRLEVVAEPEELLDALKARFS